MLDDKPIAMKIKTIIKNETNVTSIDFRTLLRNRSIALFLYLYKTKLHFLFRLFRFV